MSDITFTPGPWLREGRLIYTLQHYGWLKGVEQFENRFTANVSGCPRGAQAEEVEANARLIAAAPEIFEALAELLRVDDDWHGAVNSEMAKARNAARHALSKAVQP